MACCGSKHKHAYKQNQERHQQHECCHDHTQGQPNESSQLKQAVHEKECCHEHQHPHGH